jgi:cytosine/adenosine deaminase-related metal-dependent hydrolase
VAYTLHAAPVVVPVEGEPIRDGAVAVDGDRIVAVGRRAELTAAHPGARVRAWPGVLSPGLVNAHAHLQYSDFADLAGSGLPFVPWIRTLTGRRSQYTEAMWQASTRRGLHAMLRTGTTAVADVVTDPCVLAPTARSGLGGISYLEVAGTDDRLWEERRTRLLAGMDGAGGRTVGISPHTLYTLGTEVFRDCVAIARKAGLRVHTHLAETVAEVEYVLGGEGPLAEWAHRLGFRFELARGGAGIRPAGHLDAIGGLGPDVHVAHGVHCDAADRAVLRKRGTAVALCVRSNAILQAGEPPVAAYLAEGSPVAIGTDSLASSPSLDLCEEVRAVHALARRQGYDAADLDRRLVEAATWGGAGAMGLSDIGVLRAGARADLAVFDVPTDGDPYRALVSGGAGRCVATVLGGRIVHRG